MPSTDGIAVTQDGSAVVGLSDRRLHVAWLEAGGRQIEWDAQYDVGSEGRLLAARRAPGAARVSALVKVGREAWIFGLDPGIATPVRVVLTLHAALHRATGDRGGFLTLTLEGSIGQVSTTPPSSLPPGRWLDLDAAVSRNRALYAFLSVDGKRVVAVLDDRETELRQLTLTKPAGAIAVVRAPSLTADIPGQIVLQIGNELRSWSFDQLAKARVR